MRRTHLLVCILLAGLCLTGDVPSPSEMVSEQASSNDDDITILNRFNSLQLDIKDFIYFDLRQYFSYDLKKYPYWNIKNYFSNTIKVKVIEKESVTVRPD